MANHLRPLVRLVAVEFIVINYGVEASATDLLHVDGDVFKERVYPAVCFLLCLSEQELEPTPAFDLWCLFVHSAAPMQKAPRLVTLGLMKCLDVRSPAAVNIHWFFVQCKH